MPGLTESQRGEDRLGDKGFSLPLIVHLTSLDQWIPWSSELLRRRIVS